MKDYVQSFDAPILALTGTAAQVAQAAKAYRVYYAEQAEPGGNYSLDHSSVIYVIDPQGRFAASLAGDAAPVQMAERLKQLLDKD
jgi:protein SCO1/2